MKISKKSGDRLRIRNLASYIVVVVLIIVASEKYGYGPVLKGLGIFIGIVLFNLAVVRSYQEITFFFKTKSWGISSLVTILLILFVVGIPFVFVAFLKSTFVILGSVISACVLGVLLIYDIGRRTLG
jgi:O-antigen/teichoic acid export membrane protein